MPRSATGDSSRGSSSTRVLPAQIKHPLDRCGQQSFHGVVNTPNLPETIGRYQVLRHLASGGMADLYLCRQAGPGGFEKLVAVKRIREELCLDDEFTTMFLDESRVAALLTHANIAQIYGWVWRTTNRFSPWNCQRTQYQLIMKVLRRRRTHPTAVGGANHCRCASGARLCQQRPLGAAAQLVHRDVTPQNVLISVDGEIKLVDLDESQYPGGSNQAWCSQREVCVHEP